MWFFCCEQMSSLVGLDMQDYKSLCAVIMICASLVDPKCDFYILTSLTLKSKPNKIC